MTYELGWAINCVFLAAVPWLIAVVSFRVRRVTLAQVGLMAVVLSVGFAAPRLNWEPSIVLLGVLVGSAAVASRAAEQVDRA